LTERSVYIREPALIKPGSSNQARPTLSPYHAGVRTLRRYWFEFDLPALPPTIGEGISLDGGSMAQRYLWRGCGVTAVDEDDARSLILELLGEAELPPVRRVSVDVDVSALPDAVTHPLGTHASYGVPVWRGVWFPHVSQP
jgi:hypothetical protein